MEKSQPPQRLFLSALVSAAVFLAPEPAKAECYGIWHKNICTGDTSDSDRPRYRPSPAPEPVPRQRSPEEIEQERLARQATEINERAVGLMRAGEYAQAVRKFQEALQTNPRDRVIATNLAHAEAELAFQQERLESAMTKLRVAISYGRNDLQARLRYFEEKQSALQRSRAEAEAKERHDDRIRNEADTLISSISRSPEKQAQPSATQPSGLDFIAILPTRPSPRNQSELAFLPNPSASASESTDTKGESLWRKIMEWLFEKTIDRAPNGELVNRERELGKDLHGYAEDYMTRRGQITRTAVACLGSERVSCEGQAELNQAQETYVEKLKRRAKSWLWDDIKAHAQ